MILQVQAVDDAAPPRTGMAQVTVQVTNINDNPPIITNPAGEKLHICVISLFNSRCHLFLIVFLLTHADSSVAFSRQEDTTPSVLFSVTATDADGDGLTYTLIPSTVS